MKSRIYDLVLQNGSYWVNCECGSLPGQWQGQPVKAALHVRHAYRIPYLGVVLRNFWAKRQGALLSPIHQGG